jgi:hypothetical protein
MIGDNDPWLTRRDTNGPHTIGRFLKVDGRKDLLRLIYTMSTWNPYTAVLMESDFAITN